MDRTTNHRKLNEASTDLNHESNHHQPAICLTHLARGEKFVENRTWETKHRGPTAIHAGSGNQYLTKAQIRDHGFPTGKIIAIAELFSCINLWRFIDKPDEKLLPEGTTKYDFLNHEHTEGPWFWILTNIQPIPADEQPAIKGALGLWNWETSN